MPRLVNALLCFLLFSATVFPQFTTQRIQTDGRFQLKGKFDFENPNERIFAFDLFDEGKKLRLVGPNNVQIWDVENNKVLDARRHNIENLSTETFGGISPDKSKLVVKGFETKSEIKDAPKIKTPAKIYDIETGKLLLVLDKPEKLVQSAEWSKNGKTLKTVGSYKNETEVCFWDGETLEFRSCAVINDLTWSYLSEDGESFFTTSVPEKKGFLGIPFVNGMANVINVWNTRTAKNERNLSVGDANFHTYTFKMMPSPDGKYLALVSKNKETDTEHRVMVWQIAGGDQPKYTIKASPKIRESMLSYSPDGKFFALDAGKTVQVYEMATGKMIGEFANPTIPSFWLNDGQTVVFHEATKIRAVQIPNGNFLFEEPVIYVTSETITGTMTDSNGNTMNTTETVIDDYTQIVPHSDTKSFLTFSNQSVKVYTAGGKLVQALIKPPPVIERKGKIFGIFKVKTKDFGDKLVSRAQWANDGKSVLVLGARETDVSIWQEKN